MTASQDVPATRTCEWCRESIPALALRCPKCRSWRKDIHNERLLCWLFCIAGGLGLGLFSVLQGGARTAALFGGITCAVLGVVFYVIASRKIGTWVWV